MYDPREQPRLTPRRLRLVGIGVIAIATIGVVALFTWDYRLRDQSRDSLAARQVARMIIAHLEAREGAWPRSWDDLRPCYADAGTTVEQRIPFEELSDRVIVDFFVEPDRLVEKHPGLRTGAFRVIYLRSGKKGGEATFDPVPLDMVDANELVYRYVASTTAPDPKEARDALEAFIPPGSEGRPHSIAVEF